MLYSKLMIAAKDHSLCPIYEAINLLQEKWTLHIIRSLLESPRGFNELSRLVGGCNPATLAQRLDHLEQLGIIKKTIHSTMPPRTSYALSDSGHALQDVVSAIAAWGQQHLAAANC
jgi:DNA-binding HxlR family transcriptional regulator